MSIVNLYDGIFFILANDMEILDLLEIGVGADAVTKAKHIQKRAEPQDLVDNIPLIAFYSPQGSRGARNDCVYTALFVFDIYTADDVDKAQRIAQRIIDLFEGKINPMVGVENFESIFTQGFESPTDLANTYCFTVVLTMSITIGE